MRMPLVLAVLAAHDVATTDVGRGLPAGLEAVRVSSGELFLLSMDGKPMGKAHVGEGWYFTPLAYGRYNQDTFNLELEIERARARAESCAQLATATCAAAAASHSGYSAQALAVVGTGALFLGVALGILYCILRSVQSGRPPHDDAP